jgi:hypothetical protein
MSLPVLALGVVVAIGVAVWPVWRWLRNGVTFVHETGHAVTALLVGARVDRIHLHRDTSGDTAWYFRRGWGRFRAFLIAVAGYPAPPAAGLALAAALARDLAGTAAIVVAVAWVVVSVFWVRSAWGIGLAFVGVALGVAAWWVGVVHLGLVALSWLWLLGGVRASWEVAKRRPRRGDASDAGQASAAIPVPAMVWAVVFVVGAVAAAAGGGWALLSSPTGPGAAMP